MSTAHIVSLLIAERTKLDAAIEALQGAPAKSVYDDPTMPDWVKPAVKKTPAKRGGMSAAGRKAIGEAARKRWAALRVAKETAKVEPAPPKAPTKTVAKKKTVWTPAMKKAQTARMKAMWAAKRKAAGET